MLIGILAIGEYEELRSYFISKGDTVRIITEDQKTYVDVIVIPNTNTFNTTTKGFYPHHKSAPHYPGADNKQEFFRVHLLDYWIKKSVVVGIGTGAMILFEHLGGKLCIQGDVVPYKSPNIQMYVEPKGHISNYRSILKDKILMLRYMSDEYYDMIEKITPSKGDEEELVLVPNVPNVPNVPKKAVNISSHS